MTKRRADMTTAERERAQSYKERSRLKEKEAAKRFWRSPGQRMLRCLRAAKDLSRQIAVYEHWGEFDIIEYVKGKLHTKMADAVGWASIDACEPAQTNKKRKVYDSEMRRERRKMQLRAAYHRRAAKDRAAKAQAKREEASAKVREYTRAASIYERTFSRHVARAEWDEAKQASRRHHEAIGFALSWQSVANGGDGEHTAPVPHLWQGGSP